MLLYLFLLIPLLSAQQCDPGWTYYNTHCYKHFYNKNDKVNYTQAQMRCRDHGGYLAEISDLSEFQSIKSHSRIGSNPSLEDMPLVGMIKDIYGNWVHRRKEERWNQPYIRWCPPAPNNFKQKENCITIDVEVSQSPCYFDTLCAGGYYSGSYGYSRYVCEKDLIMCTAPNTEIQNGKCVCKKDFIDITETDVPERKKYKSGEKCVPKRPCSQLQDPLTVVFIVDSSESILRKNWKSLVEFLKMGADQLPSSANVGFVKYSDKVTFANILPGGWTKDEFRDFVPTKYDNGMTNTPAALDKARKLLKKDRNRNKIAVLITDGVPFMEETGTDKEAALRLTKKAADKLHDANIPLVALGYGPDLKDEGETIRKWLEDDDDYFAYDKLACDLKTSHMSILMQKVCRRFL